VKNSRLKRSLLLAAVAFLAFGAGYGVHRARSRRQAVAAQEAKVARDVKSPLSLVYWKHRVDQFSQIGRNEDVVMFGDSRVEEGMWAEWLQRPVSNRGIGGDTVFYSLRRLEASVPGRARVIFLQIGVNDIQLGGKPEAILKNYGELIDRLKPKAEHLVVCAIGQVSGAYEGNAKMIDSINPQLRALAARRRVEWLDMNQRMECITRARFIRCRSRF
jgi:hypothetical protein